IAAGRDLMPAFNVCTADCAALVESGAKVVELLRRFVRFGEAIVSDAGAAEIAVAVVDLADLVVQSSPNDQVACIRKVLPIIAQFAKAESSDEVVRVLEAAAMPVGSYAAKAEHSMVTLNAFAGAAAGREYMTGYNTTSAVNTFAPVGVHLSTPWWGNVG